MANNFLTDIVSPTLGSATFATELNEAFRTIDDNFKKIVSAPYLEGQEGRSIEAIAMPLVENGELTDFGRAAAREIFMDPTIETIEDIDSGSTRQPIGSIQIHNASDYLLEHPTINVLCKYSPDTGQVEDYICCAEYYCFLDMRVEDLGMLDTPSTQTQFVDYTCQLFGEYDSETGEWTFTKGVMLPTIYFNSEQGYFCWKINNVETGIRAQGIKGDAGRPPLAAVVKGNGTKYTSGSSDVVVISVTKFMRLEPTLEQNAGEWSDIANSTIQNGDLVCCLFDISDDTYQQVRYTDMLIGNIAVTGSDNSRIFSMTVPDACRFSSLWRSYILFYAFRGINYKNVNYKNSKAVFIPASTPSITHAIFQDDSRVNYSQMSTGDWSATDGEGTKNDLIFKKVRESRLIGTGSVGNSNKMTAPDEMTDEMTSVKFLGYNTEVDGTSKARVNRIPGILLGVPVGSVVSWMYNDVERIPEGWYITGDVTEYVPPVFGTKIVNANTNDCDIILRHNGEIIEKMVFTGITDDEPGTRDNKFVSIFCAIAGYQAPEEGSPLVIDTDFDTYSDYLNRELTERWSQFDFRESNNRDGLVFYLTRIVE